MFQEPLCAEEQRLVEAKNRDKNWQRWGTYLPERQWGTVREDYSADGDVWGYFPYEMAQYRAYRWGEDGLFGWTDRQCRLCFATSLWNGNDSMLKERLFGLGNKEGNHGEDVKELFYYLDATPTNTYAKALYRYPQRAFPYDDIRAENQRRGYEDSEYELLDTGIFAEDRYFDFQVEYAKADVEDTLIRLTISNRGPEPAPLTVLPTLTLRNNWSWRNLEATGATRPVIHQVQENVVHAEHKTLGRYLFHLVENQHSQHPNRLLFTENDSNLQRLDPNFSGTPAHAKDAFDRYVVHGRQDAVKPETNGTKCAFLYQLELEPGATQILRLRLFRHDDEPAPDAASFTVEAFEQCFVDRKKEADDFYAKRLPEGVSQSEINVNRQAYAGLLWTKQFYYFVAAQWLSGDEKQPPPPPERLEKTERWRHLFCRDVLSMPDKWEYPWFAAWDLAFHMIPMAEVDPEFAKNQLLLLLREWYLHPNGQMPAYEFGFSDVNPPVHAWSVWHVYRLSIGEDGKGDVDFLERAFQKLLLNFTWWVNRNDENGRNLFGGGFLGLDNIGVFDRSVALPEGKTLNQADGTAWMGLYCSCMLQIALELAHQRSRSYEDIASKFFEHYIGVIDAINTLGGSGLWDEEEGFYFDQLAAEGEPSLPMKVRSMVGITPLFAVSILKKGTVEGLTDFQKRTRWFLENKPNLSAYVSEAHVDNPEIDGSMWIAVVPKDRLIRILKRVLDETEFLSQHGVRALSRAHLEDPFSIELEGKRFDVKYTPGESADGMFGGNSNWRGPVWFPVNMLLLNSLERYYLVYGDELKIECPTGSGKWLTLVEIAEELSRRLISIFLPDKNGRRPCHGDEQRYASDPHWRDLVLFNEYFCGDTGRGIGASHQTGWTALVATLIKISHTRRDLRNRAQ